MTRSSNLLLAAALAATLGACKSPMKAASRSGLPVGPETSPRPSAPEADIRGRDLARGPTLRPVRFELDSYSLGPESLRRLADHAELLRRHPGWEVLVEGHCDDQGTDGYNLALGQRRAKAIRDHLVRSGVPTSRVATVSYGEEKPFCREDSEPCRARNRRAELRVLSVRDGPRAAVEGRPSGDEAVDAKAPRPR